MARDNSPKERQLKQLERKRGRRASYDRILIVSEGSKTEPNYFNEIRAKYRLHTANVEVRPSDLGTAPIQVVQYAQVLFEHGDRYKTSSDVRSRRSMPSSIVIIMTAILTRCDWLNRWTAHLRTTPSSRSFFRPLRQYPVLSFGCYSTT